MYLVCGEALYDFIGEEVTKSGEINYCAKLGGSPYNVAIGLARLGEKSALFTGISNDFLGKQLYKSLQDKSVSTDYIINSDNPTTVSLVNKQKADSPDYSFYGYNAADRQIYTSQLPDLSDDIKGIHFGSYSIAVKPVSDAFFQLASTQKHRLITLDPNIRANVEPDMDVWRMCVNSFMPFVSVVKISTEDIELLHPNSQIDNVAADYCGKGAQIVIITDRGEAVHTYFGDKHFTTLPPKIKVVDSVGAGDSFQASLISCLGEIYSQQSKFSNLSEEQLRYIIDYCSMAGAYTCTKAGAVLPSKDDINSMLANNSE